MKMEKETRERETYVEPISSYSYLEVARGHVLQNPDTMRPGIVVARVTAGGVGTHLHLFV